MLVFTNGCFDIVHAGHVDFLRRCRELGTRLVVGLNSDASTRAIKGPGRPVNGQEARKAVLDALRYVDDVIVFDELTPERLIHEIRPDILVKGGDWAIDEIIGADHVRSYGGEVRTLELVDGFSSSGILANLKGDVSTDLPYAAKDPVTASIEEHVSVACDLLNGGQDAIRSAADLIIETFKNGKKVLICGNGGSAADAQHIAAEFVGRYENERRGLPAIALTTDTSALTALANDYDFERIFARQVDALAVEGDLLIAISTSGNSRNVIAAVMAARQRGCRVIAMTGAGGKKLASLSDKCVMVPSSRTARIQEGHITIAHIWCELVEKWLSKETK